MLILLLVLSLLCLLPTPALAVLTTSCVTNTGAGAGTQTCTFTSGPQVGRRYRMHIPVTNNGQSRRLVVVLHGGGTCEDNSANDIRTVVNNVYTGSSMEALGDVSGPNGTVIVYPRSGQGSGGDPNCLSSDPGQLHPYQWNGYPEACANQGICLNDIAYLNAVITEVKQQASINASWVAIAGHSGGGSLVLRFACEAGANQHGTVLWSVAGAATSGFKPLCVEPTPTRLILVSGTQDPFNLYRGGDIFAVTELSIGYTAYQMIALGARHGVSYSKDQWYSGNDKLHQPDNNCVTTTQHDGANVRVVTIGSGVNPPSTDGCNWQNGGQHSWPGSDHPGYGSGVSTRFYETSKNIIDSVISAPVR